MAKMVFDAAVFIAFLLFVCVLGFFLWKVLFDSNSYDRPKDHTEIAISDVSLNHEMNGGTVTPQRSQNASEDAVARYTKWLAILTLFLVLATIGLFISGERNVEVARVTAEAARESAETTKKSVELSDKTAERQLRAYIGVNSMDIKVYPFEGGEFAFIANVEIKNFGQTPAYDLTIWSEAKIDAFDTVPFDMTKEPEILPKAGIAFPGATLNVSKGWRITAAEQEALFKREKTIFFWGTVRYTDAFKRRRYFAFRTLSTGQIKVGTGGTYVAAPHPLGYDAD
jgi:hypothetical protein